MKFFSSVVAAVAALSMAQSVEAGFEWAGAFALDDSTHQWSMQAVGGEYADPSMRLVIFATDTPDQEAIEANEPMVEALIDGECTVVEAGETIEPIVADGSCFELHVGTGDDSLYPMTTEGIAGIVVFAQHFPTEFERDMHYLKDSTGTDIEPTAQEGGDGGHDHGHGHGHEEGEEGEAPTWPCACAAIEHGFNIDCGAESAMIDSYNFMKAAGCGSDCSSEACQEAWYIVQTHHDYCDTNGLPSVIEDGFHDFDEVCESCAISRILIEGAPDCPTANCEDNSGNEAYTFLVENGCSSNCSIAECAQAYMTLRVVHDDCDHDVLSTESEEGLHDFEDVCEVFCNNEASKTDQLSCPEGQGPEVSEGQGTSGAARGAGIIGSVLILVAAVF